MCGLTGYIGEKNDEVIQNMTKSLSHRGPDSLGVISLRNNTLHMGHTRLSIIDISPNGAQPMKSKNGQWTIVFNGEIYNFEKLKQTLPTQEWRGHSDTEILVESFSYHGVKKTLELIDGMYAIALYHETEDLLYLIRDRAGEKPLYYGQHQGTFFFGSEIKSFYPHQKFQKKISPKALDAFFNLNYIPSPLSIYENIFKVSPGHFVICSPQSMKCTEEQYWSAESSYNKTRLTDHPEHSLEDSLENLLIDSVSKRMIADVNLGSFLSGGIDSTLITLFMQKISSTPVKTFTIGFNDKRYDESFYAKRIAQHLKTEHHDFFIGKKELIDIVPLIPKIFDEPFADPSQIPTYLVSKKSREQVTVCLSGDGGDELFGGYYRYISANKILSFNHLIPHSSRKIITTLLRKMPPHIWNSYTPFGPDKINKLLAAIKSKSETELYNSIMINDDSRFSRERLNFEFQLSQSGDFAEKMMLEDFKTYMSDDILVKVDRTSMACSLETRAPFLSKDIIDFAFQVPLKSKIQGKNGKQILRNILYKHLPQELIERPKMGFSVPLDKWLREDLRDHAELFLSKGKLEEHNLLDTENIIQKWNEHKTGKRSWTAQLWSVLTFQMWYDHHICETTYE